MAADSGDSDSDPRPSCSQNRRITRGNTNHGGGNCTETRKGRKRRIVMRIEFDDSGEDSSSTSEVSGEDGQVENDNNNQPPSCSTIPRRTRQNSRPLEGKRSTKNDGSDDSDDIRRNNTQRLRKRHTNMLKMDESDSDESSSGSEVMDYFSFIKKLYKKIHICIYIHIYVRNVLLSYWKCVLRIVIHFYSYKSTHFVTV